MKTTFLSLMAAALAGFVVTAAVAQDTESPRQPSQSPPLVQHHASTEREGALRGWADLGRAAGDYNYNSSLAAINIQEAIRRGLENHKQFVQDFFEKRQMNRDARFQNVERPTQQDLIRYSQQRLPDRLTAAQYQPVLGGLHWPAVLQQEAFAAGRAAIDRAMAERTMENSGVGSPNYRLVRSEVDGMLDVLRTIRGDLSSAESISAIKFLKSLDYEVRFPMTLDVSGLAAK